MGQYFLEDIASRLSENYGRGISELTLVFPGRRSIIYFLKHLALKYDSPRWAPGCITINELMQQLSGLRIGESIAMNFELHKIYREEKKSDEPFDRFYFWGEMLLSDFDEIDKYMADASLLFRTLASVREIDKQFSYLTEEQIEAIKQFWKSFEPDKYSKHQQDFIELWQVLYNIYSKLKKSLASKGIAYEGMLCRDVAEKCLKSSLDISTYHKIIFIGFNALNTCEKTLFDYLKNNNKAEFFWDYDDYYVKNNTDAAGYFLRDNISLFPPVLKVPGHNHISGTDKNIRFISAGTDIAQTKIMSKILADWKENNIGINEKTAVILADESLLIPVLNAIPDVTGAINITMGYPLVSSQAYSFMIHYLDLQKTVKIKEDGSVLFYFRNVMKLLGHQFVKTHAPHIISEIQEHILTHNRVFLKEVELHKTGLLKKIFTWHQNTRPLTEHLLDIINIFYGLAGNDPEKPNLEQEYIFCLHKGIKKLHEVTVTHHVDFGPDVYYRLIKQALAGVRIPFEGEPLQGLQVMGILETRTLDFDNIIMLSVNEGILPGSSTGSSFIPYNLRKAFGMPTVEHKDSIYAYYFFRLLHHAKNAAFIYNSGVNEKSTGEMSRYMLQLKYLSDMKITEENLVYDITFPVTQKIEIPKSDKTSEVLGMYKTSGGAAKRSFSASALNMYIDCSLKFYFRYIAGLKEPDEVTEDIDAANFGSLLHKTMELLYFDMTDQVTEKKDIEKIIADDKKIDNCILQAFGKEYFKSDIPQEKSGINGKNILIFEIIKKYAIQILTFDAGHTPFSVSELESDYKVPFKMVLNGEPQNISLGGYLDRVDKTHNAERIIDYKTGKESKDFNSIEELFTRGNPKRCKEAFQTFYYCLLYILKHPDAVNVCPSLYYVRSLFSEGYNCQLKDKTAKTYVTNFKPYADEYKKNLEELFTDIFNPQIPFTQTRELLICKNCAYTDICHR